MICAACGDETGDFPCIAFRNWSTKGYPDVPIYTEVVVAHGLCCDENNWYVISGRWFTVDEVQSWVVHLGIKKWFGSMTADRFRKVARQVIEEQIASKQARLADLGEAADARNISTATRARIMERDNFACRRCGCGPETRRLVVDHVHPASKGGSKNEANLQTLCWVCNQGKRDRTPHRHDIDRSQR